MKQQTWFSLLVVWNETKKPFPSHKRIPAVNRSHDRIRLQKKVILIVIIILVIRRVPYLCLVQILMALLLLLLLLLLFFFLLTIFMIYAYCVRYQPPHIFNHREQSRRPPRYYIAVPLRGDRVKKSKAVIIVRLATVDLPSERHGNIEFLKHGIGGSAVSKIANFLSTCLRIVINQLIN